MVVGIGTDILRSGQIKPLCLEQEDPFLLQTYTENERKEAQKRTDMYSYFCTRFAGKEAVFKSLNINGDFIRLNEIEILTKENGQPSVVLYGKVKKLAEAGGIRKVMVSLSYDTDYYMAFAVAETEEMEKIDHE